MLKRWFLPLLALLLAAAGVVYFLSAKENTREYSLKQAVPVFHYTLRNGLEVVVMPNARIPAVTHMLWVKAGGADDPAHQTGLAHFLEHMLFTGTANTPEGTYDREIIRRGGTHNAFTGYDYTAYYVTIAKEHLETVMALEADRFTNFAPTEARAARELKVIAEERNARVDNNPVAQLAEQMQAVQFLAHPYRQPLIGWREVIPTLTVAQLRDFFAAHYRASNMVLLVAGDVEPEEVRRLANQYYGTLPAGKSAARNWLPEPDYTSARRVTMRDARVQQPRLMREYTLPSVGTEKNLRQLFALEVLAYYLGGESTSYLYQTLVREQKLAVSVSANYSGLALGPAGFSIVAIPAEGVSLEQLERALDAALEALPRLVPDETLLANSKTQLSASAIFAQDGLEPLANIMGALIMVGQNENYFYRWQENVAAVTSQEIRAAAKQLFASASVTGELLPEKQAPAPSEPPSVPVAAALTEGGSHATLR